MLLKNLSSNEEFKKYLYLHLSAYRDYGFCPAVAKQSTIPQQVA
jgi:hypothetical protein